MHLTLRRLSAAVAALFLIATVAGTAAGAGTRYTGQLQWVHGDSLTLGRTVGERLVLKTADGSYQLTFDGKGPRYLAGQRITVTGSRSGNRISVESLAVAADGTGGTGSTSTVVASTTKKVAVLLFN